MIDLRLRQQLLQKREQDSKHQELVKAIGDNKYDFSNITTPVGNILKNSDKSIKLGMLIVKSLQAFSNHITSLFQSLPTQSDVKEIKNIVRNFEFPEFPEFPEEISLSPTQIKQLTQAFSSITIPEQKDTISVKDLDRVISGLEAIRKELPKPTPVKDITKIEGIVRIANPTEIDLKPLISAIKDLKVDKKTRDLPTIQAPAPQLDLNPIIEALQDVKTSVEGLQQPSSDNQTVILRGIRNAITELVNRPVMTTPPVTNVNTNPLQGIVKTTDNTVGQLVVTLPNYGQLAGRRALQIYNNSSNTIYYGGSDVTVGNGIPVTAGSFSNVIDAGYNMIVYGIASSSGNDVRIIEVSKDTSPNIQE